MTRNSFLSFLLLFALNGAVYAGEAQLYLQAESFSNSEPVTIEAIMGEWDSAYHRGNSALTVNRFEVGFGYKGWQIGLGERLDYLARFSEETAEILYRTNNHLPLDPGRSYSLLLDVEQAHSRSLRVGYTQTLGRGFELSLGAALLRGIRLTSGRLSGQVQAVSETDYNFSFDVDYFYSQDALFYRQTESPSGTGYSMDLALTWEPNERVRLGLQANDLLARIRWKDAPYTRAQANSQNKSYDDDGYVIYLPVISGFEGNEDYTQVIPRKLHFMAQYRAGESVWLVLEADDYDVEQYSRFGLALVDQGSRWEFLYDVVNEAPSLRYRSDYFSLGVLADSISLDSVRTLGINFGLQFQL
jgi:hypothetical protein